jgi:hypothetical protein
VPVPGHAAASRGQLEHLPANMPAFTRAKMKPAQRAKLEQLEIGIRRAFMPLRPSQSNVNPTPPAPTRFASGEGLAVDVPREFQRRMAAIIETVQTAIWAHGVHELLGYTTDYGLGQGRGAQTLVLKTRRRSAYVRLDWDSLMGDSAEHRQRVDDVVQKAIQELA